MRILFVIALLTVLTILPVVDTSHALTARESICKSTDDAEGKPNYFERGKTRVYVGSKTIDRKEDTCDENGMLIEYFCDETFRTISERSFKCRQGCSEGKCITQVTEAPPAETSSESETPAVETVVTQQVTDDSQQADEPSKRYNDVLGFLERSWQWTLSTLWSVFEWGATLFAKASSLW